MSAGNSGISVPLIIDLTSARQEVESFRSEVAGRGMGAPFNAAGSSTLIGGGGFRDLPSTGSGIGGTGRTLDTVVSQMEEMGKKFSDALQRMTDVLDRSSSRGTSIGGSGGAGPTSDAEQDRIWAIRERTSLIGAGPQQRVDYWSQRKAAAEPGTVGQARSDEGLARAQLDLQRAKEREAAAAERAAVAEARRAQNIERQQAHEQERVQQQVQRSTQQEERRQQVQARSVETEQGRIQQIRERMELASAPNAEARRAILRSRIGAAAEGSLQRAQLEEQLQGVQDESHGLPGGGFARHFGAFALLRTGEQIIRGQVEYEKEQRHAEAPEQLVEADLKNRQRQEQLFFGLGTYGVAFREHVFAPITGEATTAGIEDTLQQARVGQQQAGRMEQAVSFQQGLNREFRVAMAPKGMERQQQELQEERDQRNRQIDAERDKRAAPLLAHFDTEIEKVIAEREEYAEHHTQVPGTEDMLKPFNDRIATFEADRAKALGNINQRTAGQHQQAEDIYQRKLQEAQWEQHFGFQKTTDEEGIEKGRASGGRGWRFEKWALGIQNATEEAREAHGAKTPEELSHVQDIRERNRAREAVVEEEGRFGEHQAEERRGGALTAGNFRLHRMNYEARLAEAQSQGQIEMENLQRSFGNDRGTPQYRKAVEQQQALNEQRTQQIQADAAFDNRQQQRSYETAGDVANLQREGGHAAALQTLAGDTGAAAITRARTQRDVRLRQLAEQEQTAIDRAGGGIIGLIQRPFISASFRNQRAQVEGSTDDEVRQIEQQDRRSRAQRLRGARDQEVVTGEEAEGLNFTARAESIARSAAREAHSIYGPDAQELRQLTLQSGINQLKAYRRDLQYMDAGTGQAAGPSLAAIGPGYRSSRDAKEEDLSHALGSVEDAIRQLNREMANANAADGGSDF